MSIKTRLKSLAERLRPKRDQIYVSCQTLDGTGWNVTSNGKTQYMTNEQHREWLTATDAQVINVSYDAPEDQVAG